MVMTAHLAGQLLVDACKVVSLAFRRVAVIWVQEHLGKG